MEFINRSFSAFDNREFDYGNLAFYGCVLRLAVSIQPASHKHHGCLALLKGCYRIVLRGSHGIFAKSSSGRQFLHKLRRFLKLRCVKGCLAVQGSIEILRSGHSDCMDAENHKPRPEILLSKGNRCDASFTECVYRFQKFIVGFGNLNSVFLKELSIYIEGSHSHAVRIAIGLAVKDKVVQSSSQDPALYILGHVIIQRKYKSCIHVGFHGAGAPVKKYIRQLVPGHGRPQLYFIGFGFCPLMNHVYIGHIFLNGFQRVIERYVIAVCGIGI